MNINCNNIIIINDLQYHISDNYGVYGTIYNNCDAHKLQFDLHMLCVRKDV